MKIEQGNIKGDSNITNINLENKSPRFRKIVFIFIGILTYAFNQKTIFVALAMLFLTLGGVTYYYSNEVNGNPKVDFSKESSYKTGPLISFNKELYYESIMENNDELRDSLEAMNDFVAKLLKTQSSFEDILDKAYSESSYNRYEADSIKTILNQNRDEFEVFKKRALSNKEDVNITIKTPPSSIVVKEEPIKKENTHMVLSDLTPVLTSENGRQCIKFVIQLGIENQNKTQDVSPDDFQSYSLEYYSHFNEPIHKYEHFAIFKDGSIYIKVGKTDEYQEMLPCRKGEICNITITHFDENIGNKAYMRVIENLHNDAILVLEKTSILD